MQTAYGKGEFEMSEETAPARSINAFPATGAGRLKGKLPARDLCVDPANSNLTTMLSCGTQ
jgi:hypothetical protein